PRSPESSSSTTQARRYRACRIGCALACIHVSRGGNEAPRNLYVRAVRNYGTSASGSVLVFCVLRPATDASSGARSIRADSTALRESCRKRPAQFAEGAPHLP